MGVMDTLGYYLITFTAGHDTTKNSLAGGMCALAQNPDQFAALQKRPELIGTAVDEVVRWRRPSTTCAAPRHATSSCAARPFARRPPGDVLRVGEPRRGGLPGPVLPSASTAIRIRTLGFGIGEHFYLGANLARARSQRALRGARAARRVGRARGHAGVDPPSFVVGLKHLPLRYRMRADA